MSNKILNAHKRNYDIQHRQNNKQMTDYIPTKCVRCKKKPPMDFTIICFDCWTPLDSKKNLEACKNE